MLFWGRKTNNMQLSRTWNDRGVSSGECYWAIFLVKARFAHSEKFLAPPQSQCFAIKRQQNIEGPVDPIAEGADSGGRIPMRTADRLGDNFVDKVEFLKVLRG